MPQPAARGTDRVRDRALLDVCMEEVERQADPRRADGIEVGEGGLRGRHEECLIAVDRLDGEPNAQSLRLVRARPHPLDRPAPLIVSAGQRHQAALTRRKHLDERDTDIGGEPHAPHEVGNRVVADGRIGVRQIASRLWRLTRGGQSHRREMVARQQRPDFGHLHEVGLTEELDPIAAGAGDPRQGLREGRLPVDPGARAEDHAPRARGGAVL